MMHFLASRFTKIIRNLAYLAVILRIVVPQLVVVARAQSGPLANGPYTVSVFASAPAGLTNPDDITVADGDVFIGYQNSSQPDGTQGPSTVVQYSPAGKIIRTYSIAGKNDGLKYDPYTHKIWATRNEDANPALTLIDPRSGTSIDYTFAQPPPHGGGYDDILFLNGQTFIAASNPVLQPPTASTPNGQNIFPSVVKARLVGRKVFVTPVLYGNARLIDIPTGATIVAQQSDPDSLKADPSGDLVLASQQDGDLIFLNSPGSRNQAGLRLHLTDGTSTQITVDDTVFATAPSGTILVADTSADIVYAIKSNAFQPGGAYSAASTGTLCKVDLSTGFVKPIVTGMQSPHGAFFIPAIPEVRICRDGEISLNRGDLTAKFVVTRDGDFSSDVVVNYSVKDLSSEPNDDKILTKTVTIPAGKSHAEFTVPVTSILELFEDGLTQSAIVTLEPGEGYNVVRPATASVKLKQDF